MLACVVSYKSKTNGNAAQALADRLMDVLPEIITKVMNAGGQEIGVKDFDIDLRRFSARAYNVAALEVAIQTEADGVHVYRRRGEMREVLITELKKWIEAQPEQSNLGNFKGDIRFIDTCGAIVDAKSGKTTSIWGHKTL